MKQLCTTILFLLISIGSYAQAPSWQWAKSAGGNSEDKAYSIASDNAGNVYVTGVYNSASIVFGLDTFTNPTISSWNMFLVKYDASGNVIWARNSAGNDYNKGYSVTTDNAGNVYVAGYFTSFAGADSITFGSITLNHPGMFLVKYDNGGNVVWVKDLVNEGSSATSLATDNFGNIYVGGGANGDTLVIGPDTLFSNYDRFVAKFDSAGNPIWARGLYTGGFTPDINAPFIVADKYGNVYATGGFHTNNCVIVSTVLINQGDHDIYLAKFNPSGNLLWAKQYGYSGYETSTSVAADTLGNIYITGFFTSTIMYFDTVMMHANGYMAFIVKLNETGTVLWARQTSNYSGDPLKIATDKNQDVYVAGTFGYFNSPPLYFTPTDSLVNRGLFLAKYDTNGNFKWARDAIGASRATGITVDGSGTPYITGYFGDSLSFDSMLLLNDTTYVTDIYLAAIDIVTSIDENNPHKENVLSLFPNPSQGVFYLSANQNKLSKISIYNILGEPIFHTIISRGIQQIDLSGIPKGMYLIILNSDTNNCSKKIIIQ